jgi:hypothetical protein
VIIAFDFTAFGFDGGSTHLPRLFPAVLRRQHLP